MSVYQIMTLAKIRKFVDENMPEGMYFDVMEKIKLPSETGDYADYDAIIIVHDKTEQQKLNELFDSVTGIKVAVINL